MNKELLNILNQMQKERGLDKEVLIEAIESALTTAYKKHFESSQNIRAVLDRETGDISIYARKKSTDSDSDMIHISVDDARTGAVNEEETVEEVLCETPNQFMRIAAQTAKQIIVQKLRDAEKEAVYSEFSKKKDDIVTGKVHKIDKNNIIFSIGKVEAVLPASEQIPGERYRPDAHFKLYVIDVKEGFKNGTQVVVSRTHPKLVKRLFELEVPEIQNGIVDIVSVAREAGSRTKIAVYANTPGIDPIGACVGQRGVRVQNIVNELGNEKIDIITYDEDPVIYISSSLSPAKVSKVEILDEEKSARVIVPDSQLSLAIGREGQNARLAVKLTGWKIDIKKESAYAEEMQKALFNDVFDDTEEYDAETDEEITDAQNFETEEN